MGAITRPARLRVIARRFEPIEIYTRGLPEAHTSWKAAAWFPRLVSIRHTTILVYGLQSARDQWCGLPKQSTK